MNSYDTNYLIEQFTIEEENFTELAKLITQAFLNDENALKEGATIAFSEETFKTIYGAPSMQQI